MSRPIRAGLVVLVAVLTLVNDAADVKIDDIRSLEPHVDPDYAIRICDGSRQRRAGTEREPVTEPSR